MMALAPIILFAFNRPDHTRETLLSLKDNVLANESILYIYIDGPKENSTIEQKNKIEEVKKVVREDVWCKEVIVIESVFNKGLAKSIISGVTEIVTKYGKVIVLEDDLVSNKWFLKFMNDSLNLYELDEEVACISGYIYPVCKPLPPTFFIKGADCWGWATWKRSWDLFEANGTKLLNELVEKKLTYDFNFYNTYPYIPMLIDQISGKNNSWAIRWYASAYLNNKLTLYPGKSLIQNIGIDGSGINSGQTDKFNVELDHNEIILNRINTKENTKEKKIIAEFFHKVHHVKQPNLLIKIFRKVKLIIKQIIN